MRSPVPKVPIVPPTAALMAHFRGLISSFPWVCAKRLFSRTYFKTDTFAARLTFWVQSWPYCAGGIRIRFGTTAHAEAAHVVTNPRLMSARISSGVLFAHVVNPLAPTGTFTGVTTALLI